MKFIIIVFAMLAVLVSCGIMFVVFEGVVYMQIAFALVFGVALMNLCKLFFDIGFEFGYQHKQTEKEKPKIDNDIHHPMHYE